MNPEIISQKPISIYDLRKELKKISKDEESNIRVTKTEEYLNDFITLKGKEQTDMEKDLVALSIPRLKDFHIKKIIDLLPVSPEDVKVILQGYTITVTKDNLAKIAKAVKKYVPEHKV